MPLLIRLPTAEEEERSRRFQVHKNYVAALTQFLQREYGGSGAQLLQSLVQRQRSEGRFERIRRRTANAERISQFLTLSWASELQFRLAGLADQSLLQYSNAWAPIHAYYAVYMSAQAYFATIGADDIVDNHTGSLNTLSNQITQRTLFPTPWNVTCSGCPQIDETQFTNLPPATNPAEHVELLSNPSLQTFWPRYCKLLETTRIRRLDRNIEDWKRRNGRKNTRAAEKREIAARLLPTTLFDFFWRLRVRSNYRDVRTFLMAGVGIEWQNDFYDGLLHLMETSVALFENLVVAYTGPTIYQPLMQEFTESQRHDLPELRDPFVTRASIVLA
jgi:hypothetical protein